MKEEIKVIYRDILELNLLINSHLHEFPDDNFEIFNEKLQEFIDRKSEFIEKILALKKSFEQNGSQDAFKEFVLSELKELSEQIDKLEKENLEIINEKKLFLAKEINKTSKAAKMLSAYKYNKKTEPLIIDESD